MTHPDPPTQRLYHLALRDEWEAALAAGQPYRRSTIGRSFEEVGFVHCSFAHQVQGVADAFYRGRDDVVLVELDPARLEAEVRVERARPGTDDFPHVYGPLTPSAVVRVEPVPLGDDGRLRLDGLLGR